MSIHDARPSRMMAALSLALVLSFPVRAQAPYVPDVTEAREKEWRKLVSASQSAYAAGKASEGTDAARHAVALAEELFGPDDPRTLISVNDLALNLEAMKQYRETETLMRRVFDSYGRTRGEDDPNTQMALENLVDFYVAHGRMDAAGPLARYALDSFRRTSGAASDRSRRMEGIVAGLPAIPVPAPENSTVAASPDAGNGGEAMVPGKKEGAPEPSGETQSEDGAVTQGS